MHGDRALCANTVVFVCCSGRNGEESIPMLMINHTSDKDPESISRAPRHSLNTVEKSPPRLVEISSNPGTPLKVTEIKVSGQYNEKTKVNCLPFVCFTSRLYSVGCVG